MPISSWSTTPASNNAAPPNGWPEGMAPSAVNDTARQQMADHRTQWQDAEWFNWGDTVSRNSATLFKIATDVTARYTVNRRIKCYDATTLYGTIVASSYSAPDTSITVTTDSGSLTASLSSVALAILTPTSISVPSTIGRKGADIASASTVDLSVASGDFVDITGTTTITAFGTVASGVMKTLRFTGALTLTHNATSLIIPGGANITTANGDTAIVRSLGSGNWVVIQYQMASGGIITSATQAQQETATSLLVPVTPGVQHYHPSAAKFFVKTDAAGNIGTSYNVTSITDDGTGLLTVTIDTNFSSANWVGHTSVFHAAALRMTQFIAQGAGSCQVNCFDSAFALSDPTNWFVSGFGDQ